MSSEPGGWPGCARCLIPWLPFLSLPPFQSLLWGFPHLWVLGPCPWIQGLLVPVPCACPSWHCAPPCGPPPRPQPTLGSLFSLRRAEATLAFPPSSGTAPQKCTMQLLKYLGLAGRPCSGPLVLLQTMTSEHGPALGRRGCGGDPRSLGFRALWGGRVGQWGFGMQQKVALQKAAPWDYQHQTPHPPARGRRGRYDGACLSRLGQSLLLVGPCCP